MKLRIQGNSLRLRITPSEMARLLANGRIEETICFSSDPNSAVQALSVSGRFSVTRPTPPPCSQTTVP